MSHYPIAAPYLMSESPTKFEFLLAVLTSVVFGTQNAISSAHMLPSHQQDCGVH